MYSINKPKVLITGSSSGIGEATAELFIEKGYSVVGIDVLPASSSLENVEYYKHYKQSIMDPLPDIEDVGILVNNAGVQCSEDDIAINLKGTIRVTEKYAFNPAIKAVLNVASVSAHNGAEFPEYCASKGGMLAYTVNVAKRLAKQHAICNSISPGGVITELNVPVMSDPVKWAAIMEETPMRRWATAEEIADWIYFLCVINKSMTGQDVIIDNGEMVNHTFIW